MGKQAGVFRVVPCEVVVAVECCVTKYNLDDELAMSRELARRIRGKCSLAKCLYKSCLLKTLTRVAQLCRDLRWNEESFRTIHSTRGHESRRKALAVYTISSVQACSVFTLTCVFRPCTYVLYTRTHVLLSRAFIFKMGPVYITVGKAAAQMIPHGISFSRVHRSSMSTILGTVVHIVNDPHTSLLPFMLLCLFFVFICV